MTRYRYIIHNDQNPEPALTLVNKLITKVSKWYRFMGVEEQYLIVKHFRNSAIVTGKLFCSPSPRVSIDFSDETQIRVETVNITLEQIL